LRDLGDLREKIREKLKKKKENFNKRNSEPRPLTPKENRIELSSQDNFYKKSKSIFNQYTTKNFPFNVNSPTSLEYLKSISNIDCTRTHTSKFELIDNFDVSECSNEERARNFQKRVDKEKQDNCFNHNDAYVIKNSESQKGQNAIKKSKKIKTKEIECIVINDEDFEEEFKLVSPNGLKEIKLKLKNKRRQSNTFKIKHNLQFSFCSKKNSNRDSLSKNSLENSKKKSIQFSQKIKSENEENHFLKNTQIIQK
jgi:hypothetical protein